MARPIMKHDLILFDTKPIQGVIVSQVCPLPTQHERERVAVVVVVEGRVLGVERPWLRRK